MSRASARLGWGPGSWRALAGAAFSTLMAIAFWTVQYLDLAWLFSCVAAIAAFLAFVHPHRILELDEDDGPQEKVGMTIDER